MHGDRQECAETGYAGSATGISGGGVGGEFQGCGQDEERYRHIKAVLLLTTALLLKMPVVPDLQDGSQITRS